MSKTDLLYIILGLIAIGHAIHGVLWACELEKENEKELSKMLTIKLKYLADIKPISIFDCGDWIDLRAAEDYTLDPGEFKIIRLGVAMKLPNGYSAIIAPRSSSFSKWGFIQANSIGIIDNSYCGNDDEWKIPVIAFRKTTIHKNDRICQFRLIPSGEFADIEEVTQLSDENRGGFGSTGKD